MAVGLRPIVAGRNPHSISALADEYGLKWTTARVDQPASLREMAASARVLLNAARPFAQTSAPLIEACIEAGAHYLDITGEAGAIEGTARWHHAAVSRGVMLMPAVGFDVVASDCLAAHVARRLPGASTLKIGFDKSQPSSRGSMTTAFEMNGQGVLIRHQGTLVSVGAGSLAYCFDYGRGPRLSLVVTLGDSSSAFFSTGIPNIETYLRATLPVWTAITVNQYWGWLMAAPPWKEFLRAQVESLPDGPGPQERDDGWSTLVAEVTDGNGRCARSRLHAGDAYAFTALSAVDVVERILAGQFRPGFQTPSLVYGPDFALSFDGVTREDL